jgi:hypothetical protein
MIRGWALRNRLLLGIILLIAILSAISIASIYGVISNKPASNYNKSIIRSTDTSEEENALLTAENINYADVFNKERLQC